jgi:hypothetical protein
MSQVIVSYKVKPDRVEENERLVRAVYEELHRDQPDGLQYATFRLEDGVSFIHVASLETEDGHNPLSNVAAFKAFQADVRDRVEEGPVVHTVHAIGSYRLLGDVS